MTEADRMRLYLLGIKQDAQSTIARCDVLLGTPEDVVELADCTSVYPSGGMLKHQCVKGGLLLMRVAGAWIISKRSGEAVESGIVF